MEYFNFLTLVSHFCVPAVRRIRCY